MYVLLIDNIEVAKTNRYAETENDKQKHLNFFFHCEMKSNIPIFKHVGIRTGGYLSTIEM